MSSPLLSELTERIVRHVFGGKAKNESQVDYAYIESMVPKWRQQGISISYNGSRDVAGNKFIAPEWIQTTQLAIPQSERNTTNLNIFLTVDCPPMIRLNVEGDGALFVGNSATTTGFSRIKSVSYASDLVRRGDLNKEKIGYVLLKNQMRLYGDKQLRTVDLESVFADPLDCTDFNIDTDPYPVSEDVIALMERIAQAELTPEMNGPEDLINDGVDTKDRRVNKANAI
jgi:hypothetical protein